MQPLGPLGAPPLARGCGRARASATTVVVAGHGGRAHALKARLFAKREFAGYWEYVLDEALFTAPAHPQWGGAALIGADGRLLGIGSLLVQEQVGGDEVQGNMFVPIDLLEPILADMVALGRAHAAAAPVARHVHDRDRGAAGGRAASRTAGRPSVPACRSAISCSRSPASAVTGLAQLFRKVWSLGPPGTEVPLTLAREGSIARVKLRSADRGDFLKKPQLH